MHSPIEDTDQDRLLRPRVEQIVSRISRIDAREFRNDVLIRDELGIDSLMSMEILAACEKELEVRLDEASFVSIETVGEFFAFLEKAYAGKSSSRDR